MSAGADAQAAVEAYQLPDHTSILLAGDPIEDGLLAPDQEAWLKV